MALSDGSHIRPLLSERTSIFTRRDKETSVDNGAVSLVSSSSSSSPSHISISACFSLRVFFHHGTSSSSAWRWMLDLTDFHFRFVLHGKSCSPREKIAFATGTRQSPSLLLFFFRLFFSSFRTRRNDRSRLDRFTVGNCALLVYVGETETKGHNYSSRYFSRCNQSDYVSLGRLTMTFAALANVETRTNTRTRT